VEIALSYQTFGEAVGDSASGEKLKALEIPADLRGKTFLDLGCNEGFFCGEALRRGASRVVGIDTSPRVVESAKSRHPDAEFYVSSWNDIPKGRFDIVLFSSAIHYEPNQKRLCGELRKSIAPEGRLILECGVYESSNEMWVDVQRHDGSLRFPTRPLLVKRILEDYSVRYIGPSVIQRGDPLGRHVFHCFPFLPIVMIVGGPSKLGKTTLAAELAAGGVTRIDHDHVLGLIARNQFGNRKEIYNYVQDNYSIDKIYRLIDNIKDTDLGIALVKEICSFVPREGRISVLEGYAFRYENLRNYAAAFLAARGFKVWNVSASE